MKVTNLDRLNVKLDKLSKADLSLAARRGISFVQEEAKNLCPVKDGELRRSIHTDLLREPAKVTGICYTNKEYAGYVEFGTGPKGQEKHTGISPEVTPVYVQKSWWIHESQIERRTAEMYGWFHIDTPEGRFYQCSGQVAKPFMYPAISNNREIIEKIVAEYAREAIRRAIQ